VVATVSLGSHTVFSYYDYEAATGTEQPLPEEGRAVNATPILSVLLERRSAIITTSSLYTSHLHGIQELEEDVIVLGEDGKTPHLANVGIPIANWSMLAGEEERRVAREGGVLKRGTRYSLTCRDVAKVVNAKSIGRH
jgi:alkylated DNA repair protein alkB homolog 6